MPAETISLTWLLNKAWVLLLGIMWYSRKAADKDKETQDNAIAKLETLAVEARLSYITESRMKEAIREELGPYKEDQHEIKLLLRSLTAQMASLSKDMAVQNALHSQKDE